MWSGLLDLVLPTTCASCGLPGADLCATCAQQITGPAQIACRRCGHPWPLSVPSCPECPPRIDRVRHAAAYCGPVPALVRAFKDGRRRRIGRLLADRVADALTAPSGVLVPVPSAADRLRERGFNPAGEIARHLAHAWDVEVRDAVRRQGEHREQRGAAATARIRQVRGVFVAAPCADWPPVTIVDDVMTTGATLAACALALRRAGATHVEAVVTARVVDQARAAPAVTGRATIDNDISVQSTGGSGGRSHQGKEPSGHRRAA